MSDIIGVVDDSGNLIVNYAYDAWGKVLSVTGSNIELGNLNPFRYRSYYYDNDIEMYYLQSRYFDPEVCRFINSDDVNFIGATGTVGSYNAFAYCENSPVNNSDPSGTVIITTTMLVWVAIGALTLGTVGAATGYYLSKRFKVPKGSRWKYIVAGALVGAAVGAAAGFGIGYFIGGGSVVAVAGKSGTAITAKSLKLGNKLRYVFGKASGTTHNIKRSKSMYSLLKKIGIWDNKFGNEYLTKCIIEIYKNATPYANKVAGRVVREAMIYGPGGGVMMQTIWEGRKLITIYIFG